MTSKPTPATALDMSLGDIIKKKGPERRFGGRRNAQRNGYGRQSRQVRRNSMNSRFNPYKYNRNGTVEDIALGPAQNRQIKVSAQSNVKKVAGAIAHCVRIGGAPPAMICTGPSAINQAIKAIAIARGYMKDSDDPTDLIAQPQFDGKSAQLLIRLRRSRPINMDVDYTDLTAGRNSDPYKMAGAIAAKIRDGERVGINAVGAISVFHAVESIAISRTYLWEDNIDIKFSPSFTTLDDPSKGEYVGVHFITLAKIVN